MRCGQQGRKANVMNRLCRTLTYEEKVRFLKERTSSEDIYAIVNCITCDGAFFRLIIDIHLVVCYDC